MPPSECIIVENPHAEGPYGAKGLSALHEALGVWLTRIPAAPERILKALAAR